MIGVGGVFLVGMAVGPAVDAWITAQLSRRGLERPSAWRAVTRWMLPACLGVGWGAAWGRMGPSAVLLAHLVWVTVTAALVITDFEHKLVPNGILYPGSAITGVLLVIGALLDGTVHRLAGAAAGAALCLLGMGVLSALGRGALGMGDVKLSALLGLCCGYRGVEVALRAIVAGFLIGGLVGLVLILARRAHRSTPIPFAPALVAGAWLVLFGAAGTTS